MNATCHYLCQMFLTHPVCIPINPWKDRRYWLTLYSFASFTEMWKKWKSDIFFEASKSRSKQPTSEEWSKKASVVGENSDRRQSKSDLKRISPFYHNHAIEIMKKELWTISIFYSYPQEIVFTRRWKSYYRRSSFSQSPSLQRKIMMGK